MSYYGTSIPDLLKRVETETGAAKADAYLYLAVEHKPANPALALTYANKALEICREGNFKNAEIDYWTVRAILEEGISASERAIEHLQKAVAIAAEIRDEQGRLTALQKIGLHKLRQHKTDEAGEILLGCLNDYHNFPDSLMKAECCHQTAQYLLNVDLTQAIEVALKGLNIAKQIGRPLDTVHHLKMLMNATEKSGDNESALQYGLEVLRIKDEANDQTALLGVARRIGHIYLKEGDNNSAEKYFNREVELHYAPVNQHRLKQLQLEDAETYFYAGKTEEALAFAQKAIEQAQQENNERKLGNAHYQAGVVLFLNNNFEEAAKQLEFSIVTKGNSIPVVDLIATLEKLHRCYAQTGEPAKAYEVLLRKTEAETKLINAEKVKQVTFLNKRFETEKREAELRELKIKQQQAELERTESELKAIKAQMNPHFIFNALNSIQEMFFIGDKRLANEHLGKFSRLTRNILRASGKQFISLTEEIDMLQNYLELERLRFEENFEFGISVNDNHITDDVYLPPMIIQPYVENSIRHGLLHKAGNKKLSISFNFNKLGKLLTCLVEDNGIGRAASAHVNSTRKNLHESFATSANAKRLELLNQNRTEKIGVTYEDLNEGTRVFLRIPVSYD